MSDTLFVDTDPVIDDNVNYFDELVGDGKKFADGNAIAKGKIFADQHIVKLERELAEARAVLQSKTSQEEFLNQLKSLTISPPPTPNPANQPPTREAPKPTETPDIASAIDKILSERSSKEQSDRNLKYVAEVLKANVGPGWSQWLQNKAQELGVSPEYLDNIAKTQPKLFFGAVGVSETPSRQTPTAPAARANPGGSQGGRKNFAYYDKIRRERPDFYNTAAMHKEMYAQLEAQGPDDFYR